jgi:hypothetical protein
VRARPTPAASARPTRTAHVRPAARLGTGARETAGRQLTGVVTAARWRRRRATGDGDGRRDGCGPGDVARTTAVGTAAVGVVARGARRSASGSVEGEGAVGSGVRAVGTAL